MKLRIIVERGRYYVQKKTFIGWKNVSSWSSLDWAESDLEKEIEKYKKYISPTKVIKEVEV